MTQAAATIPRLDNREAMPPSLRGAIIAMGNFDGFHRGHQAVVGRAIQWARDEGRPAIVATFDPHPMRLFQPDAEPFRLTTLDQRQRLFAAAGADAMLVFHFDHELASRSAADFIDMLVTHLGAAGVVTGEDFTFGRGRGGSVATLAQLGPAAGLRNEAVAPVTGERGEIVSSSLIREALKAGDCATATRLLSRPFAVEGVVQHGDKFGRNPVGTGPFKFVSWRENSEIVVEKNPDYFEKGLPKLDKATFVLMKEPSAAIAAMLSGQVDGMSQIPVQFVSQIQAQKNLQLYGEIEGNYVYVAMNCKRAPFDDMDLRKAVAFALNREVVIKQAFFGHAIQAYTPISPPMTDFYDPNIAKSGRGQFFDLAKAKEFRAKSKVKGTIEPVFLASEQGVYGTRLMQSVLPMLAAIDIKPKVEVVERAAWIQRRNAGDFDLFDFNWWADLDPDETITPEFRTGASWNYPGWSNKRFDELVTMAQDTLDVEKRKAYYTEACDLLMNEAPIAIVSHMPVFKVFSQKVKGFKYIPVDSLNLHTVSLG